MLCFTTFFTTGISQEPDNMTLDTELFYTCRCIPDITEIPEINALKTGGNT
jgi:hypothetical protein